MTTVVFDMDGVLYRGKETLPFVTECIDALEKSGATTGYLTNNSARTREQYVDVLAGHGIKADARQVMTSGIATVMYLSENNISNKRVYVVGESGLADTLARAGFEVDIQDEGDPCDLVIVGWDRYFTFAKIARTQVEIVTNHARLIATNRDPTFPAAGGRILPGAGCMVAALETASGVKAELIGKPQTISLRFLLKELGWNESSPNSQLWIVGDRLETDIVCGNTFGAKTVLVTTGIASRSDAESASGIMRPDYVIDSLKELPGLIEKG